MTTPDRFTWEDEDLVESTPKLQLVKANTCHVGTGSKGGQFCATGSGSSSTVKVKATKGKVFTGEPVQLKTKLTKLEQGAIGEAVVLDYLKSQGHKDARMMNTKINNFPVDLLQNHYAIEVKAGLVSNGSSAQKWRATIGQPGKKETAWLKKASSTKKATWNQKKMQDILDRKQAALANLSKALGRKISGQTMTMIINTDTRKVDLFKFSGFHLHLRWQSPSTQKAYVGTYSY